jgi:hypothetical protein
MDAFSVLTIRSTLSKFVVYAPSGEAHWQSEALTPNIIGPLRGFIVFTNPSRQHWSKSQPHLLAWRSRTESSLPRTHHTRKTVLWDVKQLKNTQVRKAAEQQAEMSWTQRLMRVSNIGIEVWSRCIESIKVRGSIDVQDAIACILAHLHDGE